VLVIRPRFLSADSVERPRDLQSAKGKDYGLGTVSR
jgi:hypothetical protein